MSDKNQLSKSELIAKLEKLERDYETLKEKDRSKSSVNKDGEEVLHQKMQDNAFLTSLSFQFADTNCTDAINDIALPSISEHTGSVFSLFSLYNTEKKCLEYRNIETSSSVVSSILRVTGKKILKTENPVSDSDYGKIIETKVIQSESLTELSFGAIPPALNKTIKGISGWKLFFVIAHVHAGDLYGTSLLAFKKGQMLPSIELLQSYANLTAVALRNNIIEVSLKKSEANLKAITENTIESIWSIDSDYRLLYINDVFAKSYYNAFGVRLKRGDNVLYSLPGELGDMWKRRYDRALNNESFIVKDSVEGLQGEIIIEVVLNPINFEGEVRGVSLYGRDITEKEKLEQERLAVMERNEAILNGIPDLMLVFNSKYEVVDFHMPTDDSMWDYDSAKIIGETIHNFLPQKYLSEALINVDRVIGKGEPVVEEYEVPFQGKIQFFESRAVRSGQNEVLAIIRNITKDREAERIMLENEANVKAILENSLESIWSIDTEYNIIYANEVFSEDFYRAFNVRLEKGVNIYQSLPPPINEIWKKRYDRAFTNEHFVFIEEVNLGDTMIYVEVSINPIVVDGKVEGASLYGRDITKKKKNSRA